MDNAQNPAVDFYFTKAEKWREELTALRQLILGCELSEELKWGVPCYTFQQGNVVLLHTFKGYCALLFPKGALLHDANKLLVQQTVNTQAARQIRFTSVQEINKLAPTLRAYIFEAIELERAGLTVEFKTTAEFSVPEEWRRQLAEAPELQAAFNALTPGRQRAYLLYFAQPKQAKTRAARIAKCRPLVLAGKGLHD